MATAGLTRKAKSPSSESTGGASTNGHPPKMIYYFGRTKTEGGGKQKLPAGLMEEVARNVAMLEKELGKKFGDNANPLLVSVRSGAAVSMPGMMNTILNLGLNDEAVVGFCNATGN